MCDIKAQELSEIERMIFKFIWNKRWIGNTAPDRIKRLVLKLPYEKGGLTAPDIEIVNSALKVRQFLRAMSTNHPINFIQKYQLERVGYDDYYKWEYAKLCKHDPVILTYQVITNKLTDQFRSHCNVLPVPDPEGLSEVINIIASTDVLEYLMRRKELMIINRFGPLANIGVISYRQLLNESRYPRNNYLGELAKYILSFFPVAWQIGVNLQNNVNSEITYEEEFPTQGLQLCAHKAITVKNLRATLSESIVPPSFPYKDYQKFKLSDPGNGNPFKEIRRNFNMPRDRIFKYRILQGDVFCKVRMKKFGMTTSDQCDYCGEIETIKHMIWECDRARRVWAYIENVIYQAYNINGYVTYETIIRGSDNPITILENVVLLALKMIMSKERQNIIENNQIKSKIVNLFIIEKHAFKVRSEKLRKRWQKLENILFRNV